MTNYWKSKKYIIGIILTGSYAIKLENKNSDVDVRLLFANNYKKSVKGAQIVNGYKFSYLGRSYSATLKIISSEFLLNNKFEAGMYSIGKILYNKGKHLEEIIKISKEYIDTPFIKRKLTKNEIITRMYSISNYKNFLETSKYDSPYFIYVYYIFMKMVLVNYSTFLGYEIFIDTKTEKLFEDKYYRSKNNWKDFPDNEFANLWIECIKPENVSVLSSRLIYKHLQKKMINFDENNFKLTWLET